MISFQPLKAIFCGSLIDLETLSCRPDFSGYFDQNIAYATTMKTDYYQDVERFESWNIFECKEVV